MTWEYVKMPPKPIKTHPQIIRKQSLKKNLKIDHENAKNQPQLTQEFIKIHQNQFKSPKKKNITQLHENLQNPPKLAMKILKKSLEIDQLVTKITTDFSKKKSGGEPVKKFKDE